MDTALEIQINTAAGETTATITVPVTTIFIKEDSEGVSRWDEETQSWIEVQT